MVSLDRSVRAPLFPDERMGGLASGQLWVTLGHFRPLTEMSRCYSRLFLCGAQSDPERGARNGDLGTVSQARQLSNIPPNHAARFLQRACWLALTDAPALSP